MALGQRIEVRLGSRFVGCCTGYFSCLFAVILHEDIESAKYTVSKIRLFAVFHKNWMQWMVIRIKKDTACKGG